MRPRISRYTWTVSGILMALALAVYGAEAALIHSNEALGTAVSDFGSALVIAASAVVVLVTALRFDRGDAVRKQWGLIASGMLVYAMGDAVWAYVEVVQKGNPFPGLADVFYLLTYVLIGGGILLAARAFRGLLDLRAPVTIAYAVGALLLVVLYATLLRDIAGDAALDTVSRLLGLAYPIADVLLEFAPALCIALIARRLGRGSFGWPWWPVAVGVAVVALSDSGFALLDNKGLYAAGSIVDAGWMVGNVLIAAGALVARDVFAVRATAPAVENDKAA